MAKVEITINGVAYPCRQTMGAMLRFKQETGKEITELDPSNFTELCTFFWCCVKSASKADGIEFNMPLLDFADNITPEIATAWAEASQEPADGESTENSETPEEKKT